MCHRTLITSTVFICLLGLTSLLWQTILVSCKVAVTVTTRDQQKGFGTPCATVNCSVEFKKVKSVRLPLRSIKIYGKTIWGDSDFQLFASFESPTNITTRDKTNHDNYAHASAATRGFLSINVSSIAECYAGVYMCHARYHDVEPKVLNESAVGTSDFVIDEQLAGILSGTAEASVKKLSRLTASVEMIHQRYQEFQNSVSSLDSILGVIEPTTCQKGMPYIWSRMVVNIAGSPRLMCDTTTDGGGWIIFQRRVNRRLNMVRSLDDYRNGFGVPEDDYWLGLVHLAAILNHTENYEFRVDASWYWKPHFAVYDTIYLGPEYELGLRGWRSGKDPFNLMREPANRYWGTFNADFDSANSCARRSGGGFWFRENRCNRYINPSGRNMIWEEVTGSTRSVDTFELKIRLK